MNIALKVKFLYIIDFSILISLFLFFYYSSKIVKNKNEQGVITTNWPNPDNYKNNPEIWGQLPPKRNYIQIELTGNDSEDKIKLGFSQLQIRKMLFSGDSLLGVHFIFGNTAEYWTFITALDICRIEKARIYIPHNNNIWVLYAPVPRIDTTNQIEPIYL